MNPFPLARPGRLQGPEAGTISNRPPGASRARARKATTDQPNSHDRRLRLLTLAVQKQTALAPGQEPREVPSD